MNGKQIRVGDTVQLKSGKLAHVYNLYRLDNPLAHRVFVEYGSGNTDVIAPMQISRIVFR